MNIVNSLEIQNENFYYYDLNYVYYKHEELKKLPVVLKILLESNLRNSSSDEEFENIIKKFLKRDSSLIYLHPSRIIMKSYTGVPALIELASLKEDLNLLNNVNPKIMFDLLLDESLSKHFEENKINTLDDENKNKQIYAFLKWASISFKNVRIIPPGSGICNQMNLEYLSTIIHLEKKDNKNFIFPETIVATDFKDGIINSLGVLAWGVKSLEAQTAILGNAVSLKFPKVLGLNIRGNLKEGITSNDIVISLVKALNQPENKGFIIEFYGEGLENLSLEDRATISNLAPSYGAKSSFFPIDEKTISYFKKTRDNEDFANIIKKYLQKQNMFFSNEKLSYDKTLVFDLSSLKAHIYSPLNNIDINDLNKNIVVNESENLKDFDLVLAVITSCELTSNPYLLIHSALLAKNILKMGLVIDNKIKKYLIAPSTLTIKYLKQLDLLKYFEALGFEIKEYPSSKIDKNFISLDENIKNEIKRHNINVSSIISGNNILDEDLNSLIKTTYLMSPSLLLAYTLKADTKSNILEDSIQTINDKKVYLKDIWPSKDLIKESLQKLDNEIYKNIYRHIFEGNDFWKDIDIQLKENYEWDENSTYIQSSNFSYKKIEKINILNAGILAVFKEDISCEEISPRGQINLYSQSARYLEEKGLKSYEYDTYDSRRGNSEIMLRGTFDYDKLKNHIVEKEGAFTKDFDNLEIISFYEKSILFKNQNRPLVIFAGNNYGKGKQIDWAVKGTKLLGVKAIIANSFDLEHKNSLIKFGILPLEFIDDEIDSFSLTGEETIDIYLDKEINVNDKIDIKITLRNKIIQTKLLSRLDNEEEISYYKNGGILPLLV